MISRESSFLLKQPAFLVSLQSRFLPAHFPCIHGLAASLAHSVARPNFNKIMIRLASPSCSSPASARCLRGARHPPTVEAHLFAANYLWAVGGVAAVP